MQARPADQRHPVALQLQIGQARRDPRPAMQHPIDGHIEPQHLVQARSRHIFQGRRRCEVGSRGVAMARHPISGGRRLRGGGPRASIRKQIFPHLRHKSAAENRLTGPPWPGSNRRHRACSLEVHITEDRQTGRRPCLSAARRRRLPSGMMMRIGNPTESAQVLTGELHRRMGPGNVQHRRHSGLRRSICRRAVGALRSSPQNESSRRFNPA